MIWSQWDEIHWKEGIKASPIIQHEVLSKAVSTKLYNVEELDHKVHELVTIPGMTDMQSQDNGGMADSGFNFLQTRA